jgi:hypothetical protein
VLGEYLAVYPDEGGVWIGHYDGMTAHGKIFVKWLDAVGPELKRYEDSVYVDELDPDDVAFCFNELPGGCLPVKLAQLLKEELGNQL